MRKLFAVGLVFAMVLCFASCSMIEKSQDSVALIIQSEDRSSESEQNQETAEDILEMPDGEATVHFIDVGQGDCILIDVGKVEVLVDCGDSDHVSYAINYMKDLVDGNLDYLVATHPDADHIGGIMEILKTFAVGTIIDSGSEKDTSNYVNYKEEKVKHPETLFMEDADIRFNLTKGAELDVIETGDGNDDVNEDSVICMFRYGEKSVFLTGDMGIDTEEKNLTKFPKADVLKAGHHGSANSTGMNLLRQIKPDYVIISVGKDNDYGHPAEATLQRIASIGAKVYSTAEKGTIILKTDGKSLSFDFKETPKADEIREQPVNSPKEDAATVPVPEAAAESVALSATETPTEPLYIGNKNTHKFHEPWCSSVDDMAEHNKVELYSREEAINLHFQPCKRCNP